MDFAIPPRVYLLWNMTYVAGNTANQSDDVDVLDVRPLHGQKPGK